MNAAKTRPLLDQRNIDTAGLLSRSAGFADELRLRRTVRDFSPESVPLDVIRNCLNAAGSAPSGANLQPWHFVVVHEPEVKRQIRQAAELEEKLFYEERAPEAWLEAIRPLGTNWNKPFLEIAPYLIAIFVQPHGFRPDGTTIKHYYAVESVGIATGMLITALHQAGLATLTHTPSPMGFLNQILDRPAHERPFLLLVVGRPADGALVPDIEKKSFSDYVTIV